MTVVTDASPLIALAAIGRLDLLERLFGRVLIPEAVSREVAAGEGRPGAPEVSRLAWIHVRAVKDRRLVRALEANLGRGEAEAIALAVEERAAVLLVDERRARRLATQQGVRVLGVLGVLIEAKRADELDRLRPALDELQEKAGFRISPRLRRTVLRTVHEV